jgi:hypothetical protein
MHLPPVKELTTHNKKREDPKEDAKPSPPKPNDPDIGVYGHNGLPEPDPETKKKGSK